jgi:DNA-binding transcriptional LysR family regulator
MMPAILRAYQKAMPKVRVKLHDWPNEQSLAGLRDRRLQLAFGIAFPKGRLSPAAEKFWQCANEAAASKR